MDRGKKILFKTFWCSSGWCSRPPLPEEFALAREEGYMFDPAEYLTHDETLQRLCDVLGKISPADVANAFVYSLSNRALAYRSALGSYYYALAIPAHSHEPDSTCCFCNWDAMADPCNFSGYNVFSFERHKWGGVRHTSPEYALFDLEQFLLLPKVMPSEADWDILKSLLQTMQELPASKKAGAYRDLITKKKLLKSNKDEVAKLLDILGICGVLSGANAPCYCDRFVDVCQRSPLEHTNDFAYPVNRWHVSDGVNEERFKKVFGFPFGEL